MLTPPNADSVGEQGDVSPAVAVLAPASPAVAAWRQAGLASILVAVSALLLFRKTAWLIVDTWATNHTFSHGFLIVPIFLYLVWIRRARLLAVRPRPSYWMLAPLALLAGLWLAGSMGDVNVVREFALVGMLEAMLWVVLGTAAVRALWFPLLFLFFAVPFGDSAIGPLQDFTAHFAVGCLRLTHVPVVLENRTIWVPSGPWVVAQACSGIRFLIASVVLGLVYASLVYRSRWRRAIFLLASFIVPVVANGFRAYGIILLGYLTDNRLAMGVDHIVFGWIFFTAIQLLLFSVGLRWREPEADGSEAEGSAASGKGSRATARMFAGAALCAMLVAAMATTAEAYLWRRAAAAPPQTSVAVNAPWQAVPAVDRGWEPLLHPSSTFRSSYVSGDHRVDVYIARYSGREGVELVSSYNQVADARWAAGAAGLRTVTLNGHRARVRWNLLQSAGGSRLVWTWYWAAGEPTSDATEVKLAQTKARLLGEPTSLAVMAVSTGFLGSASEAAEQLQDFLNHGAITLQSASK